MPPEELGELNQLQELSLDHNQLTVLPSSMFHLVHLTYLNISYNPLGNAAAAAAAAANITTTATTNFWLIVNVVVFLWS